MKKQLEKVYDPSTVEDRLYKFWTDGGYFHAEADPEKEPYTIVIPPPNITGQLHMGHALDETLQDILIRFRRMQGGALAARHRPCVHCDRGEDRRRHGRRGADQGGPRPRQVP